MAQFEDNQQIFNLKGNEELRFLTNNSSVVSIELLSGSGEIFGVEMLINKIYSFSSPFAIVTWHGCTLKLKGSVSRAYTVTQRCTIYDIHTSLEYHRKKAENHNANGPIVLIAGPTDVGKSTLSRSLLNYAARCGRKPLFVDLDVGQSSISIPGTMGILPINNPSDIVKGFNEHELSVYYFGYKSPGINILLYFLLITKLGETLHSRFRNSENIRHSGAIIDTCGWVTGQGYKSILVAARSFEASLLIVLADKKLYSQLQADLPSGVEIQFIPKLGGTVERNRSVRILRRDALIQEYFYGTSQFLVKPYTFEVPFSEIKVCKVSSPTCKVSLDMLHFGHKYISLLPVLISPDLLNHVLAVSYCDDISEEDVMLTSVLGFICITGVDMNNQVVTILCPQPSPLPKKILLMGDMQFFPSKS